MGHRSHEAEACRQLWIAVILTTLRDLLLPTRDGLLANQARAWIGTADFRSVCALAGLDAQTVADGMRHAEAVVREAEKDRGPGPRPSYFIETAMRKAREKC
ncbi:hypothetical protein [Paenirhodobacter sp. CAU 1674]|uniref:hypothetical protein n=1 Tax=Paenirhodobacter sp. CAU 1674 TaxID=3032596 RepID=UPI0023DB5F17|nr:hypothetical protein [Paenirhodobacter sp. CAU 1674]MDF2143206.1 hypothetical protein [Paenirhodobacter sp. CAU 1674]